MSRLFRFQVDEKGLVDGLYSFITEPRAAVRNALPIVMELREGPNFLIPWDLVENMVLDGVEERQDVADYVQYVVGHMG